MKQNHNSDAHIRLKDCATLADDQWTVEVVRRIGCCVKGWLNKDINTMKEEKTQGDAYKRCKDFVPVGDDVDMAHNMLCVQIVDLMLFKFLINVSHNNLAVSLL